MRTNKEISICVLQDRDDETELNRKKRADVIKEKGSCENCLFSLSSSISLRCKLKKKPVNKYNFCEKWEKR